MAHAQDLAVVHPQITEAIECTHEDLIKLLEDTRSELEEKLNELEMLSVQATCMIHEMVTIRTDPSVVESMMRLNDVYLSCKESLQKEPVNNHCVVEHQNILEETIKRLGTMSEDMDKIYVRTHLLLCDLIICFSSPEKMEVIKRCEESYRHHREISDQKQ